MVELPSVPSSAASVLKAESASSGSDWSEANAKASHVNKSCPVPSVPRTVCALF